MFAKRFSNSLFLSTLSLRRATSMLINLCCGCSDFYPRSPCGERHLRVLDCSKSSIISIHALLAESDFTMTITICTVSKFLSTLSLRRATTKSDQGANSHAISIHALLAESDPLDEFQDLAPDISIHALLAESDLTQEVTTMATPKFLSTLSLRRATRT